MATSVQNFITGLVRKRLRDEQAQVFSDQELYQFTLDALQDHSELFPRRQSHTFLYADAADTYHREWSLSDLTGIQRVFRVRFPVADDPPQFLDPGDEEDPDGFYGDRQFTTRGDPPDTLVLGVQASSGDSLKLDYTADHEYPDSIQTDLTVPDGDLNLLACNVVRRSVAALRNGEAGQPSLSLAILSELISAANAADNEYENEVTRRQRYGTLGWLY